MNPPIDRKGPLRRRRHASGALPPRHARGEPLEYFLRDIHATPVLTATQEAELARAMRSGRAALRAALANVPGVAQRLVCLWRERGANDWVPERLSERYEQGVGPTAELSALAQELAALLPRALRCAHSPARALAREQLGAAFERFDPRTPLLLDWCAALERSLAAPEETASEWGLAREPLAAWAHEAAHQRDAYLSARARFAEHNLRLVVHIAKDFQGKGAPLADLVQEGNVALLRAVEKFDERRGFRFSTYAGWWIVQALQRCARREAHLIALPDDLLEDRRRLRERGDRIRCSLGRAPTAEELACASGLSAARLARVQASPAATRSLESPLFGDDARSLADVLADPASAEATERLDASARATRVERLLADIEPRERAILVGRFGLGGTPPRTLKELADEFALSRERIRQIETRVLARLEQRAVELGLD